MKLTNTRQIRNLVYNRKIKVGTQLLDRDGCQYEIDDIGMKYIYVSPAGCPDPFEEDADYWHDKLTLDDLLNWEVLE